MKLNVQIIEKRTGYTDENTEIVNIDINNGNWKYWDWMMDNDEKISLTINNINQAYYLHKPVKEIVPKHDLELYRETGELKQIGTSVSYFESLVELLNYRIDNVKEDCKRFKRLQICKERTINAVLLESAEKSYEMTADSDVRYRKDDEIVITIRVVE